MMTAEQIAGLGPALMAYLRGFGACIGSVRTAKHLDTYCRGLLSDLPRKSVEPMALASGTAVRTLQEFLTHHDWDHLRMRDQVQRRFTEHHIPPPDAPPGDAGDDIGVVGWIDETSVAKKGHKTPGVQRQHCGSTGKIDNCIVTVHLAAKSNGVSALLDSDLFLPEKAWDQDRDRCREAHIPDDVVYRPKHHIALEQVRRAMGLGVRFDWLTFDEWYGGKPKFLFDLDALGQRYICEVPANFSCFPTRPRYRSLQAPFAPKQARHAVRYGKPFRRLQWRTIQVPRQTLEPQTWKVRAAQVYLSNQRHPTERSYWLIVARNVQTEEIKYFVSNASARTSLLTLMKVAFTRFGIEHLFRLVKTEVGFNHFEGRSYRGLLRHMILCQVVLLFIAEQTDKLNSQLCLAEWGEKGGPITPASTQEISHACRPFSTPVSAAAAAEGHDGTDRPRAQRPVPTLAGAPLFAALP
jgi:SRSO17 transposase